jgi:hypothetical protein
MHDFSSGTIQTTPAVEAKATGRLPNIPGALFPWWYKHHPWRWHIVDGEVLPRLGKLKGDPGIGGVDDRGNTSFAKAKAEEKGWQIIPWDALGEHYVVEVASSRGKVYLPKWMTLRRVGNRVVPTPDIDAYHEFCRRLISEGIIAPPDPAVIDGMVEAQRQRFETVIGRLHDEENPTVKRELAALENAEAATGDPVAVEKVAKRKAAKKKTTRKPRARKAPAKKAT